MAISDESAQNVNAKMNGASVSGVFYLGNVFELIINCLNNPRAYAIKAFYEGAKVCFSCCDGVWQKIEMRRPHTCCSVTILD